MPPETSNSRRDFSRSAPATTPLGDPCSPTPPVGHGAARSFGQATARSSRHTAWRSRETPPGHPFRAASEWPALKNEPRRQRVSADQENRQVGARERKSFTVAGYKHIAK